MAQKRRNATTITRYLVSSSQQSSLSLRNLALLFCTHTLLIQDPCTRAHCAVSIVVRIIQQIKWMVDTSNNHLYYSLLCICIENQSSTSARLLLMTTQSTKILEKATVHVHYLVTDFSSKVKVLFLPQSMSIRRCKHFMPLFCHPPLLILSS